MIFAMVMTTLAMASATPQPSEVKQFGGWLAACDNETVCTAVRPLFDAIDGSPKDGKRPFLLMRHYPHRDSTPEFSLVDLGSGSADRPDKPTSVEIIVRLGAKDGSALTAVYAAPIDEHGHYKVAFEDSRSVLYGLRIGVPVQISTGDGRLLPFDSDQFEAVLAHFDAQQGLEGTAGAFVRKPGEFLEDYAHPVPPDAPTVQLTAFASEQHHNWQVEYPERMPDEIVHIEPRPEAGQVGVLRAKSLDLDCGVYERWGHIGTGNDFVLLERREMPVCNGIMPPHWIRTYRTETLSPEAP